ncbi:hypothetical protein [Limibacterium fermenti]|uniref:hypothetical protein n=1 Tax=Limibacterium fermenti TaxID=3229863 RepID=UPI003A76713E
MELRFTLISDGGRLEITEPVGFDQFEPEISRNEMHGVSVEFSDIDMEFTDCEAVELISGKYEENIDSVIELAVSMKCSDGDEFTDIYNGKLDLATYQLLNKGYTSVKCKVGQAGVLTTFNNRISTDICVDDAVSVDGNPLEEYACIHKVVSVPGKALTSVFRSDNETATGEDIVIIDGLLLEGSLQFPDTSVIFTPPIYNITASDIEGARFEQIAVYRDSILDKDDSVYVCSESDKLTSRKYKIQFRIDATCKITGNVPDFTLTGGYVRLSTDPKGRDIIKQYSIPASGISTSGGNAVISIDTGEMISEGLEFEALYLAVILEITLKNFPSTTISLYYNSSADTYFEMQMETVAAPSDVRCSMVHEVLSRVSESITDGELKVRSDYYGRADSEVETPSSLKYDGPGGLRALTNGYKLRDYIYTDGSMPRMYVSMKKMIQSLSAIDNTGCGFSREAGRWWVRVEDWAWFYQDTKLFSIDHPAHTERVHNAEETYTRLRVGYKKYADISETNVTDTFHSERNYSTYAKAVDKELNELSDFVADAYVIEYTRRKSLEKDTKDWQYDETLFILCLMRQDSITTEEGSDEEVRQYGEYEIDNGMEETGGSVISPETMLNVYISPARNARRWAARFAEYPGAHGLGYASGTRNTNARGKAKKRGSVIVSGEGTTTKVFFVQADDPAVVQENAAIGKATAKLKAQLLKFEYPISLEQYQTIRMNPYGYILVDGEKCWIKSVKYGFKTGLTKFELIPEWK